ncbi:uncharacterized protein B0I36DRAFT_357610 [Microdochium trichocladiopsis]|uniref:BSD domain-containing protein n=1 Tax=Microdochium trichocladiopsis TaxID=1682393 RepID=A0A9P9BW64_9PEZI|nr:uncharacterized protein B0I36DRAFT_357610 [Microdochium trichocladiopsis]KAH7040290.1 hypothetical protein B0I36DRAFT_357610 [Microdochium trichocladiopsis]
MDLAYDNIAKEALPEDQKDGQQASTSKSPERRPTLNDEVQDVYRAFTTSSWGSWFGGQVSNVVKQGQSVLQEAQQEVVSLSADASRQIATLRSRAFSINTAPAPTEASTSAAAERDGGETTPTTATARTSGSDSTFLSKVQAEASKRWKDIQRAEDAADEKLMELGGYIFNVVKQSIEIQPGSADDSSRGARFESKDESGKRVIHTSRFDAQLHVIHTTEKGFTEDPPASTDYKTWAKEFDIDKKTESISADLTKYPDLRATMEKVVPDTVPYADFWKRYYFLRRSVEAAEERRRDLLKAASAEEEVKWDDEDSDDDSDSDDDDSDSDDSDDDSDDDAAAKTTPKTAAKAATKTTPTPATAKKPARPVSSASSATIQPTSATSTPAPAKKEQTKGPEPRKSNDEKSQPDSDTSYDVVGAQSGVTSRAPNSPKDSRKGDDSDDDEWE